MKGGYAAFVSITMGSTKGILLTVVLSNVGRSIILSMYRTK